MMEHCPEIPGLTTEQLELCEQMWALKDADSVDWFIQSLDAGQQQIAVTLRDLMIIECLEPFLEEFEYEAKTVIDYCSRC